MQQGPASKELSSLDAIKQQLGSSQDPSPVTNVAFFESTGDPSFVAYEEAGQCLCSNVSLSIMTVAELFFLLTYWKPVVWPFDL